MTTRIRIALLLVFVPTVAVAGGLLGKTLKYYETPKEPGDRHATFTVRTNIVDRDGFGVILYSDPIACKGQLLVRQDPAHDYKVVTAEKSKPFTVSSSYFVWIGLTKTTCQVVATLVPTADRYEVIFGVDEDLKACAVQLLQAGPDGVLAKTPDELVVKREPTLPFSQSGAFCKPMGEDDAARIAAASNK